MEAQTMILSLDEQRLATLKKQQENINKEIDDIEKRRAEQQRVREEQRERERQEHEKTLKEGLDDSEVEDAEKCRIGITCSSELQYMTVLRIRHYIKDKYGTTLRPSAVVRVLIDYAESHYHNWDLSNEVKNELGYRISIANKRRDTYKNNKEFRDQLILSISEYEHE